MWHHQANAGPVAREPDLAASGPGPAASAAALSDPPSRG